MSVQFKVFSIPAAGDEESEKELNKFLRTVRPVYIHKEFIQSGSYSYWAFAVEYLEQNKNSLADEKAKKRIDYREVLSPEDFTKFSKLREWRKEEAAKDGVPVYSVFTNSQLALIVEKKIISLSDLKNIEGVGSSRIEKYGSSLIEFLKK